MGKKSSGFAPAGDPTTTSACLEMSNSVKEPSWSWPMLCFNQRKGTAKIQYGYKPNFEISNQLG